MKLDAVVLDSSNSEELADFYSKLLGWSKEVQFFDGDKWVIVKNSNGEGIPLVFQEISNYERPTWPSVSGSQQQMLHLDFYVQADDFDSEVSHAISCGATLSETQLSEHWKVFLDPAGHPFCIIPLPK